MGIFKEVSRDLHDFLLALFYRDSPTLVGTPMEANEGIHMLMSGQPTPNSYKHTSADNQESCAQGAGPSSGSDSLPLPPRIASPQPGLPNPGLEMTLLWVT